MKEPTGGKGAGAGGKAVSLPVALHMTVAIDGRSGGGVLESSRACASPSLLATVGEDAGREGRCPLAIGAAASCKYVLTSEPFSSSNLSLSLSDLCVAAGVLGLLVSSRGGAAVSGGRSGFRGSAGWLVFGSPWSVAWPHIYAGAHGRGGTGGRPPARPPARARQRRTTRLFGWGSGASQIGADPSP